MIKVLLERGAKIDEKDDDGWSALHYASNKGHLDAVTFLLNRGLSVNIQDKDGATPLIRASSPYQLIIIKKLLSSGADINARTKKDGDTPLMIAVENRNLDVVKFLLKMGINVNARDNHELTALTQASVMGYADIVRLLLENGADINSRTKKGVTTLMIAAESGQSEVVKTLIEYEPDINARINGGHTALTLALFNGHVKVSQLLLDNGAVLFLGDRGGARAVREVLSRRNPHIISLMETYLRRGPQLLPPKQATVKDSKSTLSESPEGKPTSELDLDLHQTAALGNIDRCDKLLGLGADINSRGDSSLEQTPLMVASGQCKTEVVKFLCAKGAVFGDNYT